MSNDKDWIVARVPYAGDAPGFGGYESAQAVLDAYAVGAIIRIELLERALLATLGRDNIIDFDTPAAQVTLKRETDQ